MYICTCDQLTGCVKEILNVYWQYYKASLFRRNILYYNYTFNLLYWLQWCRHWEVYGDCNPSQFSNATLMLDTSYYYMLMNLQWRFELKLHYIWVRTNWFLNNNSIDLHIKDISHCLVVIVLINAICNAAQVARGTEQRTVVEKSSHVITKRKTKTSADP